MMWERARKVSSGCTDSITKCRGCRIGAANAGKPMEAAPVQQTVERICPRCSNSASKFVIDGTICVSCFNRQREVLIGSNRRGNRPMSSLRGVPARWSGAMKPRTMAVYVRMSMVVRRRSVDKIVNGVEAALRLTRSLAVSAGGILHPEPVFAFAYPRAGIGRL